MRNLILLLSLISLTSCAGAALKKDWKEKRGYSDADIQSAMPYHAKYSQTVALGGATSNAFDSSNAVASEARIKNIYCSCVKKLGKRCAQKPDGLSGDDRELWSKANGAELALTSHAAAGGFSKYSDGLDPDECN